MSHLNDTYILGVNQALVDFTKTARITPVETGPMAGEHIFGQRGGNTVGNLDSLLAGVGQDSFPHLQNGGLGAFKPEVINRSTPSRRMAFKPEVITRSPASLRAEAGAAPAPQRMNFDRGSVVSGGPAQRMNFDRGSVVSGGPTQRVNFAQGDTVTAKPPVTPGPGGQPDRSAQMAQLFSPKTTPAPSPTSSSMFTASSGALPQSVQRAVRKTAQAMQTPPTPPAPKPLPAKNTTPVIGGASRSAQEIAQFLPK